MLVEFREKVSVNVRDVLLTQEQLKHAGWKLITAIFYFIFAINIVRINKWHSLTIYVQLLTSAAPPGKSERKRIQHTLTNIIHSLTILVCLTNNPNNCGSWLFHCDHLMLFSVLNHYKLVECWSDNTRRTLGYFNGHFHNILTFYGLYELVIWVNNSQING